MEDGACPVKVSLTQAPITEELDVQHVLHVDAE